MLWGLACSEVTDGLPTLAKFEDLPTTKQGIFVMPAQRVGIHSTYVYTPEAKHHMHVTKGQALSGCEAELADLKNRFDAQALVMQRSRSQRLP